MAVLKDVTPRLYAPGEEALIDLLGAGELWDPLKRERGPEELERPKGLGPELPLWPKGCPPLLSVTVPNWESIERELTRINYERTFLPGAEMEAAALAERLEALDYRYANVRMQYLKGFQHPGGECDPVERWWPMLTQRARTVIDHALLALSQGLTVDELRGSIGRSGSGSPDDTTTTASNPGVPATDATTT